MNNKSFKNLFYIALSGLGIVLLIGGGGIINIKKIYTENKRIENNINVLVERNGTLKKEIQLLKTNDIYQEKVIREILDLSKENEIIYEFE